MSNLALIPELQERIRQLQTPRLDTPGLPTHPALARLLPGGALQEGATYSIDRSLTLLMLLLAAPSAAGIWCGVVGVPEFGVEAAAGFGIDLERLALVPRPGDQSPTPWASSSPGLPGRRVMRASRDSPPASENAERPCSSSAAGRRAKRR